MGDAGAGVAVREGRAASGEYKDKKSLAQKSHNTVLSDNLRQAVCLDDNREGVGCLHLDGCCGNTSRLVV